MDFEVHHLCGHKVKYRKRVTYKYYEEYRDAADLEFMFEKDDSYLSSESCPHCKPGDDRSIMNSDLYYYMVEIEVLEEVKDE